MGPVDQRPFATIQGQPRESSFSLDDVDRRYSTSRYCDLPCLVENVTPPDPKGQDMAAALWGSLGPRPKSAWQWRTLSMQCRRVLVRTVRPDVFE